MNLGEGRVGEKRTSLVSAIGRCDVAAARIGRQIEHISISPAGEHDCICCMPFHFPGAQASSNDSLGLAIDDRQVEHLRVWKHLHRAGGDLATERLVAAKQELLAGLSTSVKGP